MNSRTEKLTSSKQTRFVGTIVLGLLFSLALSYGVIQSRLAEQRGDFIHDSQAAVEDYRHSLQAGNTLLSNFELLFEASSFVNTEEFLSFVRPQMGVGDFVGVSFMALLAKDNPYAATLDEGAHYIEVGEGKARQRFAFLYMAHLEQEMEHHDPAMHMMHTLGDGYQQAIPRAIASGESVVGGLINLNREKDTLVVYQPTFSQVNGQRKLLGFLAVLIDPLAALERVQASHQLNLRLYVDHTLVGESRCCDVSRGVSTLHHQELFTLKGVVFRLDYERTLEWTDIGIKGAVLAFLLGLLTTFFAYRLRESAAARLALLQERNRVIRRQVDEQTRAWRQSNTELKQQKSALDEHAIVSIADTGGSITYVNDKFCEVSGYTRDELIGRNHRLVKSDQHPPEFYAEIWSTITQGKVWHGVLCNRAKSDEEYWVNSTIVPFLDERGKPYQYVSIRSDITPIISAEAALARSDQELSSILDTVPALIWYKDSDSRIVRANRAAAELSGLSPEEMAGRPHTDFFPAEAVERYREHDLQVLDSGEPLLDIRESLPGQDGIHHYSVDRVPYRDEAGRVVGLIVMAHDITRQEETERALLQNEERLRRSQTFANIGTWDWNVPSGELHWSERIAPLFGHGVGELETTYENFINAVHPDDRDLVQNSVAACLGGADYNIEHRVVWPDGQVRWLSETGDVVRDAEGNPLHMLGVVQDIHDRKMAEAALLESEQHLKEAQRMGAIGHWTLDMASGALYWSDEIFRIFGREPGEFEPSYERFFEIVHPDDVAMVKASEEASRESGSHKVDHRIICADGSVRWVHEEANTILNEAGEVVRMVGTVQDISERKLAEAALTESEEKFRSLYEMSPVGIALNGMDGSFIEANQSFLDIVGYTTQECRGQTYWELTPQEYAAQEAEQLESLKSTGRYGPYEKTYIHKDGHRVDVLLNGTILHDIEGNQRIWSIVQDISKRKLAEVELNRFKSTLDVTEDCVFMFDPDAMYFFYANQGAREQVGYSKAELEQMHPYDLKPDYDRAAFLELVDPLIENGGGSVTFDTTHQHKSGALIPVEIALQYIAPQGEPARFVAIVRNISERKQMQQKLVEAKETAEQANRAKSEFLSSMSHELRTPMNAILGFSQLMEDDENLTAEQRESLGDIGNAGNHLLELINEVLDLAKIESGKLELSIGNVAVAEVMAAGENLIVPMAETRDITLQFSPACSEGHFIHADFTRTKQVILNLLSNAVKYNRHGGSIQVDCQPVDNARLRISVSDSGEGIPEVKLQGLFEAFNRLDAEGSNIEGTGIGLVITRQLVELMGGEMGVESVVGEGSTFWFELPCGEGERVEKKSVVTTQGKQGEGLGEGQSVLYIEDNPVNLKLVSKLIDKRTALTMYSAEEPVEGIELALERRPDLILLDINLPEMSGFEVLRHLRDMAETRDIPVVALSANAMANDLQKGEDAGFDDYLTKPINVKEFFAVLAKQLG